MFTNESTFDEQILQQWCSAGDEFYVGLLTALPSSGLDVPGTEVSTSGGSNYSRVLMQWSGTIGSRYCERLSPTYYDFPVAGSNWGSIVGLGLWSTPTGGGAPWITIPIDPAFSVVSGDTVRVLAEFIVPRDASLNSPIWYMDNQSTAEMNLLDSRILPEYAGSALDSVLSPESGLYVALLDINGQDITEVSGDGYVRQLIEWSMATATLPATKTQSNIVTFTATGDWPSFNHIGFYASETDPPLLAYIDVPETTLLNGQSYIIGEADPISVRLT
jgi:hypothetical protein